jgi:hypothetical protein
LRNQSRADWILTNVFKFFRQALIMPQPMIEKISLPIDLRHSHCDSPKITDEAGKLRIAGERQSTCAGGLALAAAISDTTAATNDSALPIRTERSHDPCKADLHPDVGSKL